MEINRALEKIQEQKIQIDVLTTENTQLLEKQEQFQNALINKIQEIKQMGPFKRFFAYGRLLMDLIETIEKAISEQK
tara:strand:- start:26296 stop:26526 length:231 start_codon:yes stop_codon:yes gene_type:complete